MLIFVAGNVTDFRFKYSFLFFECRETEFKTEFNLGINKWIDRFDIAMILALKI